MSFFDKLKQKALEKMIQQAAGKDSAKDLMKSMGASETDMSEMMQAVKGMDFSSLMGLLKAFNPGQPVTGDKIRSVFDPAMLQQFASKLQVPIDKAPEKIAEMINLAMSQMRSSK